LAVVLDGIKTGKKIENDIKTDILNLKKADIIPGLAVLLVGDDKPSHTYVNLKHKKCIELGIYSEVYKFSNNVTEIELLNKIYDLNINPKIHGILVQLPLPEHICSQTIINSILPEKDVDGFHPQNIGLLAIGKPEFIPCTPFGVLKLIEEYDIKLKGKNAVVIGCSNVVGKPLGLLLQFCETATCTICHIHTKNISEHTLKADVIISAVGSVNLIKKYMIKPGAAVIDVGFNVLFEKDENGIEKRRVCGDVDFAEVEKIAGYITPVPGGVGPMTITMLMYNTVLACKKINHII
jgi:methylenetetrahydrofolate dehydrogenase (NADP+)/methenyltetrahydrofolate cyclohydrolase